MGLGQARRSVQLVYRLMGPINMSVVASHSLGVIVWSSHALRAAALEVALQVFTLSGSLSQIAHLTSLLNHSHWMPNSSLKDWNAFLTSCANWNTDQYMTGRMILQQRKRIKPFRDTNAGKTRRNPVRPPSGYSCSPCCDDPSMYARCAKSMHWAPSHNKGEKVTPVLPVRCSKCETGSWLVYPDCSHAPWCMCTLLIQECDKYSNECVTLPHSLDSRSKERDALFQEMCEVSLLMSHFWITSAA